MPAATDRKLRVFLCHSSQDKPIVRELYQRLNIEGWIDPWLDEEKLLPGQDWGMEIEKAAESADAVIVCLSNNSITKEGYVQRELRFVLDIALTKPEETIFIIPLRLESCELPRRLRYWEYADYFPIETRKSAYSRLVDSLRFIRNKQKEMDINSTDFQENADAFYATPKQEFRHHARDLFSKSPKIRQIAMIEIGRISVDFSLKDILAYLNSSNPHERVACSLALREKIRHDNSLGENSEVKKAIMILLTDKDSRVRCGALEVLFFNRILYDHFCKLVEIMEIKERNKKVKELVDALLHG